MRRRLLFCLLAGTAAPAQAQDFDLGRHVPGVRLAVGFDAYDVTGSTGAQIMRQLQVAGRPSWTRYPALFSWTYDAEVIHLLNGNPSDQCRFTDFEITLDFTAVYPRWQRPPDADPELVAAWEAFGAQIDRQWARQRDEYLTRATEVVRRARDYEDYCPLLVQRFHGVVLELMDRSRSFEGHRAPDPIRLAWPPDGYEALLNPEALAAEEGLSTTRRPDDTPPNAEEDSPSDGSDPTTSVSGLAVAVRPGRPRPVRTPAPDLEFALQTDLRGTTPAGFVAGLYHEGTMQYFNALGSDPRTGDPLTIDTPMGVPAFTDLLISTLAVALDRAGVLDLDAPLSTYLEGMSPRLGELTTRQLLEHRGGLDNAPPPDSTMAWEEVLDRLDDRALMTEPGILPSYSSYSFGLVTRVIERITGATLEDVLRRTLLEPLGMSNTFLGDRSDEDTVGGLPVTYVSAADVMRFWLAWLNGNISGAGSDVLPDLPRPTLAPDGRAFRGGLWLDRPGALPRLSLMCGSGLADVVIQVFPLSSTILLVMGTNGWPGHTGTFMLDAVGRTLRIEDEIFGPVGLSGVAGFARRPRACRRMSMSRTHRPVDFGPRAEGGDWVGRYVNGDWFFALEAGEGGLISPRPQGEAWHIHHFEGDTYFASVPSTEGRGVGFPFRLFRGPDGRRYLMLDDRAYLHEDDRPGS